MRGALVLTLHGRAEIVNGICLAAFRRAIGAEAMRDALASFDEDLAAGRYAPADLLWRSRFLSFDARQRQLARAAGLRVVVLAKSAR